MSSEWKRFEQVLQYVYHGRKLFRSAAPNYDDKDDESQNLTPTAVKFLTDKGINGVISFNTYSYTISQIAMLDNVGISYRHFAVKDFTAPTEDQLKDAIEFFRSIPNGSVLIHCGYGHGRTGTGVTAMQLFATWGDSPDESKWNENHVETNEQRVVLRRLRDNFKKP
ncbi:hypothetical protein ACEPAH_4201 [Sanghuangporus vaninii]